MSLLKRMSARGLAFLFAALFAGAIPALEASAATSTLVVLHNRAPKDVTATSVETRRRLDLLGITQNLKPHYQRVQIITPDKGGSATLLKAIRTFAQQGPVDLIIMGNGPDRAALQSAGKIQGLRLVYLAENGNAALAQGWQKGGARTVVAQQAPAEVAGFFSSRFLRAWAQGKSVTEAARASYSFGMKAMQKTAALLRPAARTAPKLEPVVLGANIDIHDRVTKAVPVVPLRLALADEFGELGELGSEMTALVGLASPAPARRFAHNGFEGVSMQLMTTMVPQVPLEASASSDPQALLSAIQAVAWEQVGDLFPPVGEDGEVVVDGQTLRYLLGPSREFIGDKLWRIVDSLRYLKLARGSTSLRLTLHFYDAFAVNLIPRDEAADWNLYSLYFPETVQVEIAMNDGIATVTGLSKGVDTLHLSVKMPLPISDNVTLRKVSLDLATGELEVAAGVAGNMVGLAGKATLSTKLQGSIDLWGTVQQNAQLMVWPLLFLMML